MLQLFSFTETRQPVSAYVCSKVYRGKSYKTQQPIDDISCPTVFSCLTCLDTPSHLHIYLYYLVAKMMCVSDALRSNFFGTSSDPIQRPRFGSRSDPDPIFYRWNYIRSSSDPIQVWTDAILLDPILLLPIINIKSVDDMKNPKNDSL